MSFFHNFSLIVFLNIITFISLSACSDKKKLYEQSVFTGNKSATYLKDVILNVNLIDQDKKTALAINHMNYDEARKRLSTLMLKSTTKTTFEYEKNNVSIEEKELIEEDELGNIHVYSHIADSEGIELKWINNKVYIKDRFSNYRVSTSLYEVHKELTRRIYNRWAEIYALFDNGLDMTKIGPALIIGRDSIKFRIDYSPELVATSKKANFLPLSEELSKLFSSIIPVSAKGEIVVDKSTCVILSVKFSGKLKAFHGNNKVLIDINHTRNLTNLFTAKKIKKPKKAEKEIFRKTIPVDKLDFYKKSLAQKKMDLERAEKDKDKDKDK